MKQASLDPQSRNVQAETQEKRKVYVAPRLKRQGDLEKITQTSALKMFFAVS